MGTKRQHGDHSNHALRMEILERRALLAGDAAAAFDTMPGDCDRNGSVEYADFAMLAKNFGATDASWEDGDFDGDHSVGFGDFAMLAHNFGKSYSTPVGQAESSDVSASPSNHLAAQLDGEGPVHGEAEYESEHAGSERQFEVEVERAQANTTYPVSVNGTVVGQIATNEIGYGKLKLSTSPRDGEQPLPDDFPILEDAATVEVGDILSGSFTQTMPPDGEETNSGSDDDGHDPMDDQHSSDDHVDAVDDSDDDMNDSEHESETESETELEHESHDESETESETELEHESHEELGSNDEEEVDLESRLSGAVGHGKAEFESNHHGNEKELKVEIQGALPNTTYAISVDEVFAGNITTDARGLGTWEYSSTPANVDPFPVVSAGSIITVGDLLRGKFHFDD